MPFMEWQSLISWYTENNQYQVNNHDNLDKNVMDKPDARILQSNETTLRVKISEDVSMFYKVNTDTKNQTKWL